MDQFIGILLGYYWDMHQYEVFRSSTVLLQTNKHLACGEVDKNEGCKPETFGGGERLTFVSNGPMISTAQAEMSPIKGEQDEARFLFYLETWRSGSSFLKETMVDGF